MRYCGPAGLVLRDMFPSRAVSNVDAWFAGITFLYTHKGRTAIRLGCELLELHRNGEVLAPSYNCGTEIDALVRSCNRVTLYRIDRSARIDFHDLESRVTRSTKAIYVTHYFGFPQDLRGIKELCGNRGIYLIEDCALSLFSRGNHGTIGATGDISIFSLPKTLPVPDGGALVINRPEWIDTVFRNGPPGLSRVFPRLAPLFKAGACRAMSRNAFLRPFLKFAVGKESPGRSDEGGFPDMPRDYYFDEEVNDRGMSGCTRNLLRKFDPESIVSSRRRNFGRLLELLEGKGIGMLFRELPPGACPLYFPVLVGKRDAACSSLIREGIASIPWWAGYHRDMEWGEFPDACFLKDNVLALPVHQDLEEEDIAYMAEKLTAVLAGW
jgi:perosamine synthetase